MLEMARRRMDDTTVRIIDDEFNVAIFQSLTPEDIMGSGRLRPVAARHFVERAERVQTLSAFYQSGIGQDQMILQHISSVEMAKLFEELLDLRSYKIVEPYIRITEQAEAQQISMQHEEDTLMGVATPSGMTPEDYDEELA
jgi:hypothetical protein